MDLDPRSRAILNAVVEAYIDDAQPQSSAAVAQRLHHLAVSPATIRNVMAELETAGLLHQPHTSSGRVPTDQGLRVYLDGLGDLRLRKSDRARLEATAANVQPQGLPLTLGQSLADLSGQVAVVGVPRFVGTRFKEVALVRYDAHRFVAFFVSPGGLIQQKLVEVEFDVDAEELLQAQNFLNDRLRTHTVNELRTLIQLELEKNRQAVDSLRQQALELGARALPERVQNDELELIVEGASHLVGQPEFANPRQLRALLEAIEDRRALLQLLQRILDSAGVKVVLGSEHNVRPLEDVTCVGSTWHGPAGQPVAVTLLGPARMDYGRLMPLVDHATKLFGRYWEII
jgi:heat-inducible transcriptional repressor